MNCRTKHFLFWLSIWFYFVLILLFWQLWFVNASSIDFIRFVQWTNIFYLWPTLRAIFLSAWAEAGVFFATFFMSTIHHGCMPDIGLRYAVAADTFWLLFLGIVVVMTALTLRLYYVVDAIPHDPIDRSWKLRYKSCYTAFFLITVLIALAVLIWSIVEEPTTLDGCLYYHGNLPVGTYELSFVHKLVPIWSTIDFVTALAAIVIITLYFLQVPHRISTVMFWYVAIATLSVRLLERAGLIAQEFGFIVLFIMGGFFILTWILIVMCAYTKSERATCFGRYDCADFIIGLLIGTVALVIFLEFNNVNGLHGWWHIIGAGALFAVLEGVYRDQSFLTYSYCIKA